MSRLPIRDKYPASKPSLGPRISSGNLSRPSLPGYSGAARRSQDRGHLRSLRGTPPALELEIRVSRS